MKTEFEPVEVTRGQVYRAALNYVGVQYIKNGSYLKKRENGIAEGHTNCYGLFLQVAKDVGLLPENFDINLPPGKFDNQSPAKTLMQIIYKNFSRVGLTEMKEGDLILLCNRDTNPALREAHHVALCMVKAGPYGGIGHAPTMIHAFERRRGHGVVCVQTMDALIMSRVESVWKIKGIKEG